MKTFGKFVGTVVGLLLTMYITFTLMGISIVLAYHTLDVIGLL